MRARSPSKPRTALSVRQLSVSGLSISADVCDAFREIDEKWPAPDKVGKQELEVISGNDHISFTVR